MAVTVKCKKINVLTFDNARHIFSSPCLSRFLNLFSFALDKKLALVGERVGKQLNQPTVGEFEAL